MGGTRKPYTGPEPYIFISYARKDAGTVYPLLDALTDAGYRYWYDINGIPPGSEWADVIAEKITKSAAVLAFHSEASKESPNCREEVYYTLSERKKIVSVYVDGVKFEGGLKMRLSPYQALKLSDYATPAAFIARLGEDEVFAPCREPLWNRIGEIQWKLDMDGVLTIAKNEYFDLEEGSIPGYQRDPVDDGSTAPWMQDRKKIRAVVIQNNISTIGDRAFYGCRSLTAVTIPDSVTKMGDYAFDGCTSLTAVTIPDSVTKIGEAAFMGCYSLTAVTIPDSVTIIGQSAFSFTQLTAVTIPDSVTKIGEAAFMGCYSLTAVTIPDSVTKIGRSAFHSCTSLTTVMIPNSVTEISWQAFDGCTSLTAVTIPDSVTKIGFSAFKGCRSLTAVTIPNSVTEIGAWAFTYCEHLTAVTIPDSVTKIGELAFYKCPNLKRVEIPAGAKVYSGAFDDFFTEVIRRSWPA